MAICTSVHALRSLVRRVVPIVALTAKEPVDCLHESLHSGLKKNEAVGDLLDDSFQSMQISFQAVQIALGAAQRIALDDLIVLQFFHRLLHLFEAMLASLLLKYPISLSQSADCSMGQLGCFGPLANIHKVTFNRRCRCHHRTHKMRAAALALASFEVAV
jgi:hypothetical protein